MTTLTHRRPPAEAARDRERRSLRRHPLMAANPEQIDQWVEQNVTDIESAKEAIKVLAKLITMKP